jgi:dTDP-4-amino-4,6-dideoxy-D-galactose acyltransferase
MTGDAPAELLPWDTAFFGFRIGRVRGRELTRERAAALAEWARAHDVQCLYYLCDAADTESVRSAEADGYRLTDVRLVFERDVPGQPLSFAASGVIRCWQPADVIDLRRIARGTFSDTRFHHDRGFPAERCRALYEEWVSRSCDGFADAVLVVEHEGRAGGFVTCHLDPARGRIGLIGLDPSTRGRQLGRLLVGAALRFFAQSGQSSAEVATQARNVAAQRLYQHCGFRTASVHLWYHRWFTVR